MFTSRLNTLAAKIGEPAVATKDGSKITRADFKRGRT
jgi:hypothetical protein